MDGLASPVIGYATGLLDRITYPVPSVPMVIRVEIAVFLNRTFVGEAWVQLYDAMRWVLMYWMLLEEIFGLIHRLDRSLRRDPFHRVLRDLSLHRIIPNQSIPFHRVSQDLSLHRITNRSTLLSPVLRDLLLHRIMPSRSILFHRSIPHLSPVLRDLSLRQGVQLDHDHRFHQELVLLSKM